MTEEALQSPPPAPKAALTKEDRSRIMKEAATRRWERQRKEAAQAARASERAAHAKKKASSGSREFSSALKAAEKQLAKALHDRDEAASRYALANAQIPSLMRIINALKSPGGSGGGEYAAAFPALSLDQIVSDQPLPYQNPPSHPAPAIPPVLPVPQQLHPANAQSRAQGGAVGVALDDEPEEAAGDENRFLRDSAAAGGEWH